MKQYKADFEVKGTVVVVADTKSEAIRMIQDSPKDGNILKGIKWSQLNISEVAVTSCDKYQDPEEGQHERCKMHG